MSAWCTTHPVTVSSDTMFCIATSCLLGDCTALPIMNGVNSVVASTMLYSAVKMQKNTHRPVHHFLFMTPGVPLAPNFKDDCDAMVTCEIKLF